MVEPRRPEGPENPYRWVGLAIAVIVFIASMLYHVEFWYEFD